jgi:hypothetical protein
VRNNERYLAFSSAVPEAFLEVSDPRTQFLTIHLFGMLHMACAYTSSIDYMYDIILGHWCSVGLCAFIYSIARVNGFPFRMLKYHDIHT